MKGTEMNYNVDYVDLYEQEKKKDVARSFSRFMLSLFLYILLPSIAIVALEYALLFAIGAEATLAIFDDVYMLWVISVLPMYLIGLPVLVLMTRGMKKKSFSKRKLSFKDFGALFLISEAFMMLGAFIGNFVMGIISSIIGRDIGSGTSELIEKSPLWITFIVAVIIGPIVEEFIFRKLLIDRLGRYGDGAAILTSGIAFGIFHGNLEQLFYATLLGFLLAFVYTKTGNWWHTVLLHMAVNFFGSIVAMPVSKALERLTEMGDEITDMLQYVRDSMMVTSYTIFQYASITAGLIILISAIRKKKIQVPSNSQIYIPNGTLAKHAVFNTGTVLFLILSILTVFTSIFMA